MCISITVPKYWILLFVLSKCTLKTVQISFSGLGDLCNISRKTHVVIQSNHSCLLDFFVRINLPLFSTVVPAIIFVFLSCRPFVAITTLSAGLVSVEVTSVSWLGQLTVGV